jgi:RimJ/RimL family protein N-acetyltransferase
MRGSPGTRSQPQLSLRPLTAVGARQIQHWFDHPEVQRRLGGRGWIHRELRLIAERPGSVFRGQRVLRSHAWVAHDRAGTPVAFIGGDVYDRWARYLGEGPDGPLLSDVDPRRAMGFGYVVDPARWRQGYGRAAIEAALGDADVADVEVFYCGIDADNQASRRCAAAAGFRVVESASGPGPGAGAGAGEGDGADPAPVPDFEGMLYYRREAVLTVTQH